MSDERKDQKDVGMPSFWANESIVWQEWSKR